MEFNVKAVAKQRGIENPFALQAATEVGYAICYKLWNGNPKMIALETLSKLCTGLNCQPGDLLVYKADAKDSRRKRE